MSDAPPSGSGAKRRRSRVAAHESDGGSMMESRRGEDSEGSGEDLLGDNMADDYRDMGQLDAYDSQMLDEREYEDDVDARLAAEEALRERDRREGRRLGGRLGAAAVDSEDGAYILPYLCFPMSPYTPSIITYL